jgi:hypothetical protein
MCRRAALVLALVAAGTIAACRTVSGDLCNPYPTAGPNCGDAQVCCDGVAQTCYYAGGGRSYPCAGTYDCTEAIAQLLAWCSGGDVLPSGDANTGAEAPD